jgi:uncharacterized protein
VFEKIDFLYAGPTDASVKLFLVADALGTMLIGMGLFKTGFLSGGKSYSRYAWTAVIGLAIAEPLYLIGMWKSYPTNFYGKDLWRTCVPTSR